MLRTKSHLVGSAFVAFAFAVAMTGTTLPTPLYPLYNRAFGLAPVLTPVIFATYALGVVATPLFLGYLSGSASWRWPPEWSRRVFCSVESSPPASSASSTR